MFWAVATGKCHCRDGSSLESRSSQRNINPMCDDSMSSHPLPDGVATESLPSDGASMVSREIEGIVARRESVSTQSADFDPSWIPGSPVWDFGIAASPSGAEGGQSSARSLSLPDARVSSSMGLNFATASCATSTAADNPAFSISQGACDNTSRVTNAASVGRSSTPCATVCTRPTTIVKMEHPKSHRRLS